MSIASFCRQAAVCLWCAPPRMGTARKFSELRSSAFALTRPTLGWAGLGWTGLDWVRLCRELGSMSSPSRPPESLSFFPSFSLPLLHVCSLIHRPVGGAVEDQEGCIWAWSVFCSSISI